MQNTQNATFCLLKKNLKAINSTTPLEGQKWNHKITLFLEKKNIQNDPF
jgi:hypothetical protein